jgi:hypothetical protein
MAVAILRSIHRQLAVTTAAVWHPGKGFSTFCGSGI